MRLFITSAIALSSLSVLVAAPAFASIDMYTVVDGEVQYADTYETAEAALRAAASWAAQGVNVVCSVDGGELDWCSSSVLSEATTEDESEVRGSGRGTGTIATLPSLPIIFHYAPQKAA